MANAIAQQFTGLPIKALIGGPLIAAASANGQMALDQTNFLFSTCFEEDKDGGSMTPIMIKLNLTRNLVDENTAEVKPLKSTIEVPLMTLIPLNQLAVDDVSVNFDMEIKTSSSVDDKTSDESTSKAEGSFSGGGSIGPFSVHVSGSVSSSSKHQSSQDKHYSNDKGAKYSISVHAGQLPLPPGVTTIVQAYAENISPVKIDTGSKDG